MTPKVSLSGVFMSITLSRYQYLRLLLSTLNIVALVSTAGTEETYTISPNAAPTSEVKYEPWVMPLLFAGTSSALLTLGYAGAWSSKKLIHEMYTYQKNRFALQAAAEENEA